MRPTVIHTVKQSIIELHGFIHVWLISAFASLL